MVRFRMVLSADFRQSFIFGSQSRNGARCHESNVLIIVPIAQQRPGLGWRDASLLIVPTLSTP